MSPDGSIVVAGDRPNFGEPGSVRGWNASTGALSWQVDLPNENGGYQIAYTQPRFSADSRTAYFGTAILGGGGEYSFLYAVDTGVGSPPSPLAKCVVPGVVGAKLDTAQAKIRAAGCAVGLVTQVRSPQVGRVIAQSPPGGHEAAAGRPGRSDRRAHTSSSPRIAGDGRMIQPVPGFARARWTRPLPSRALVRSSGGLDRFAPSTFSRTRAAREKWAIVDSNHGPPPYQSGALTN